jgi:type III pantothenate kinase
MMLLIDIGNTRVKWSRLFPGGTLGEQTASSHGGWTSENWRDALFGGPRVDRVIVASVAGDAVDARLAAAAKLAGARELNFVATLREAAGVRNGYADPAQLGVDRWVAVIGAFALCRSACVVADVGTAATIDLVHGDGRHLGGYIVPGPALMVNSLLRATSDLGDRHASGCGPSPGAGVPDNTRDAIEYGCPLAVATLVDRCVMDAGATLGGAPRLYLTGGAALSVLPNLRSSAEHCPDLVLRGLAVLASTAT